MSLNIPDLLRDGPKPIGELATLAKADELRLNQVLRFLNGRGIFDYNASKGIYSNNVVSSLLLKDHWSQWWRWTDVYGNDYYDMAQGLERSMVAGCPRTAAQTHYDTDKSIFQYFKDTNQMEKMLKCIAAGGLAQAPGMTQDYSWADIAASGERLLDVGGGSGGFMTSLLRAYPDLKGAVLDQESVIKTFTPYFREPQGQFADVGDRCELIVGDFFGEIPPFKYYSIRWCLHDWLDEQVVQILGNIRKGIIEGPDSRLVVIEMVLTQNRTGSISRYGDVAMMVSCAGRQRTEDEWRSVAEPAGWRLAKVVPLRNCWASAIELRPAGEPNAHSNGVNGAASVNDTSQDTVAASDVDGLNGIKGANEDITAMSEVNGANGASDATLAASEANAVDGVAGTSESMAVASEVSGASGVNGSTEDIVVTSELNVDNIAGTSEEKTVASEINVVREDNDDNGVSSTSEKTGISQANDVNGVNTAAPVPVTESTS